MNVKNYEYIGYKSIVDTIPFDSTSVSFPFRKHSDINYYCHSANWSCAFIHQQQDKMNSPTFHIFLVFSSLRFCFCPISGKFFSLSIFRIHFSIFYIIPPKSPGIAYFSHFLLISFAVEVSFAENASNIRTNS